MKLTKTKLKALIKEEIAVIINEEEALDLSKLEPTVEKAAAGVLNMAKGVSGDENVQRMIITALIAKLSELIK